MVEANHSGLSPKMANLLMAQRNAVGGGSRGSRGRPQSGSHRRSKKKSATNQSSSSQGSVNSGIRGVNIRRDSSAAPIQRLGNAEEVFKVMPGIKSPRGHKNFYEGDQH